MKKILFFLLVLFVGITVGFAQPQKMTYQTVVRNSNNELVVNQQVGIRVSILEDSVNGPMIYRETHTPTTNINGLVTIMIGDGIHPYTNTLADVKWDKHTHYLSVEIDPLGGTNYTIFGAQQMVSVPYAFYSESASYVDTADYAKNALHADTAYYLANFQNSDTSLFSYHCDTALLAYNADTAVYANSSYTSYISNLANYSDSTRISNYANTANSAISANTANYATSAGSAATAISATYADSAQVADFAHNADTAVYANSSYTSYISNSANYADSTRISDYANTANTANYATSAGSAATATSATYADSAQVADFAHNADTAVYANSSYTSYISNSANYADSTKISNYANSANLANYADSSNYNHLANKPVGVNNGDILYWDTTTLSWHIVPVGNIGEILTLDSNKIPYWSANFTPIVGLPAITTDSVINITTNSARVAGTVTSDGGAVTVFSGICWSTLQNPTIADFHTLDGFGLGSMSSNLTGLAMGTTYYTRAYATNSAGTAYGNELTFRTLTYPTVITTVASNISVTTASSGGNITDDGGAAITARGVCWSTSINPTVADSYTSDGTGIGNFNSSITGLVAGTTYYLRAYATNSVGTAYGSTVSFTTLDQPTVITNIVTNITSTTAVSGGDVTNEGGTPVTVRGIVWNTVGSPDINSYIGITSNGGGMGTFTATMTSLTPGQTYYVRAYATNIINTSYGQEETFSANPIPPIVNTNSVSNVTNNTATVDGSVVDSGGATVIVRGFCYNTSGNPTIADNVVQNGSGIGNYSSNLTGLTPGQTYYICAYATNSAGTAYGSTISFTTLSAPCGGIATITDYDGNVYNTLEIGLQCWMKENLRTTHYSNGTLIDLGSGTSSTNKYRYYPGNNSSNVATYGYLYNWTAAMNGAASTNSNPSGVQGVCPTGWHVPSDAEWTQLINYVSSQSQYMCGGTSTYIAKALANTTGWNTASGTCVIGNNLSGNNATGFGAMPAGMYYGSYAYFGTEAYYLCATAVYLRKLYSGDANVNKINRYKEEAYSVRCVRN